MTRPQSTAAPRGGPLWRQSRQRGPGGQGKRNRHMKKTTEQIKVGDTIKVWWSPGRDTITELQPYTGPLLETLGMGTKIASFALNITGMTLVDGEMFEVVQ